MSPISRGSLQLVAGADGTVPPMAICLGAYDALDEHGGGSGGGAVLLALRTSPGDPAPDGPLDLVLLDEDGNDCFYGGGRGRSHLRPQSSILRAGRDDLHCIIFDGEVVTLHISGNRRPGAVVHVELTYSEHDASPREDEGNGRISH